MNPYYYNGQSGAPSPVSVLTGSIFQTGNTTNSGMNFGTFGSVSRVNMTHSAGTGTVLEVNYRIQGSASGNVLTPTDAAYFLNSNLSTYFTHFGSSILCFIL